MSELAQALKFVLKNGPSMKRELITVMGTSLLPNRTWPSFLDSDSSMGSFFCAVLKAILTPEEAAYCLLGPPRGVPRKRWLCCLAPCPGFRMFHSVNMYTVALLRLLGSGRPSDAPHPFDELDEAQEFMEQFPNLFRFLNMDCRSNRFEPIALVPVEDLPGATREEVLKALELTGAALPQNGAGLFVCPLHFGADWTNKDLSDFSFHDLTMRLSFQPFNVGFRATNFRQVQEQTIPFVKGLVGSLSKQPSKGAEPHEPFLLAKAAPQIHREFPYLAGMTLKMHRGALVFDPAAPSASGTARVPPGASQGNLISEIRTRVASLLESYLQASLILLHNRGIVMQETPPHERCRHIRELGLGKVTETQPDSRSGFQKDSESENARPVGDLGTFKIPKIAAGPASSPQPGESSSSCGVRPVPKPPAIRAALSSLKLLPSPSGSCLPAGEDPPGPSSKDRVCKRKTASSSGQEIPKQRRITEASVNVGNFDLQRHLTREFHRFLMSFAPTPYAKALGAEGCKHRVCNELLQHARAEADKYRDLLAAAVEGLQECHEQLNRMGAEMDKINV